MRIKLLLASLLALSTTQAAYASFMPICESGSPWLQTPSCGGRGKPIYIPNPRPNPERAKEIRATNLRVEYATLQLELEKDKVGIHRQTYILRRQGIIMAELAKLGYRIDGNYQLRKLSSIETPPNLVINLYYKYLHVHSKMHNVNAVTYKTGFATLYSIQEKLRGLGYFVDDTLKLQRIRKTIDKR